MPASAVKKTIHACCPEVLRPTLAKLEASEIGYRFAKGAFWSLAGAVISRGLGILASIVVARTLGKAGFGELGIIHSTIGLFQVFAGFGLGLTATKYVAEYRRKDPEKAGRIIGLAWMVSAGTGALCALLLIGFAPWLSSHVLAAPHLSGLLRIAAVAVFISALNAAQGGALSGFEAFKTIATRNLIAGVLDFPVTLAGVLLAGIEGAVWAMAVSRGIGWLLCHLALRHEADRYHVRLTLTGCMRELPLVWSFSLPSVVSSVMVTPVNWLCNAMLVNQINGYSEMGLFGASSQWRMIILFVPSMLGQVNLSLLSSLNAESTSHRYRQLLTFNLYLNTGIAMIVALPMILLADFIMGAYGKGFEHGGNVLRILAIAGVLMAANKATGQALVSKGAMWTAFSFNVLWALVLLLATRFLLSRGYGALGLAWAILIAYLLHTLWQGMYIRRFLDQRNEKLRASESSLAGHET